MVMFTYFFIIFVSVMYLVVSDDGYENSKPFEHFKHKVNNGKKEKLEDDTIPLEAHNQVVMCSIWNWTSREHSNKFDYTMFDGSFCTHLVYSVCSFNNDGRLNCGNNQRDIPPIMSIKDMFPHLLVLLELSFNLTNQHHLIKDEKSRRNVLQTGVDLMRKFQFDGISLHVSLPMTIANHSDHYKLRHDFYTLVKDLASMLWKYKYWISLRVKNYNRQVLHTLDLRSVTEYVDFLSIYMLDTGGVFKPYFPLRGHNEHDEFCLDYQLRTIRSLGIPMSKVLVVILVGDRHMYPDYDEVKYEPPKTGVTKLLEESEEQSVSMLCKDLYKEGYQWVYVWDSVAHVWFTYRSGSTDTEEWSHIIAYETPRSIIQKVRFAMQFGVLGFYVSHANWDDTEGTCPTTFIYHKIYEDVKKDFNQLQNNIHMQAAIPFLELPDNLTTKAEHLQWPIIYLKNGKDLSLGLPLRANTSYSSLKSVRDGIMLYQQEETIMNVVSPSTAKSTIHDRIVMCGIQNWLRFIKVYQFNYDSLDASLCTHLVYRSLAFNENLELTNFLENHDEAIPPLVETRHQYSHLQFLLEISLEIDSVHHLIRDNMTRYRIIQTAITFMKDYSFDGISLFITVSSKEENNSHVRDRDALYNFMKDLSSELRKDELYMLHLRVMNYNKELLLRYKIRQLIEFVDYFSLYMSDTDGVFKTWFPLHGVNEDDNFSLDYQIQCLMRMGIPMKKVLIVLVFGGRNFLPVLHSNLLVGETRLREPPQFKTVPAVCTVLNKNPESWVHRWDNLGHVGYSYRRGRNHTAYYEDILTYETPRTLIQKVRYSMQYGVRGFIIPNVNWDDSEGICSSSLAYGDNYRDLKNDFTDLQNNYDLASIVHSLKLPKFGEINLQNLQYPQYAIDHGALSLVLPIRHSTNFSSLRAMQDGIIISMQDNIIQEALNSPKERRPPKIRVPKKKHTNQEHHRHRKHNDNKI